MQRRAPDQEGPAGEAWHLPASRDLGAVGRWLVRCPKGHPFWQWWVVSIGHLQAFGGVAKGRFYPKAEYEFVIYAIDPEACAEPDPEAEKPYPELIPLDVVEQFDGVNSEQAERLCSTAVQAIVMGLLSPDGDHLPQWKKALCGMIDHIRKGASYVGSDERTGSG